MKGALVCAAGAGETPALLYGQCTGCPVPTLHCSGIAPVLRWCCERVGPLGIRWVSVRYPLGIPWVYEAEMGGLLRLGWAAGAWPPGTIVSIRRRIPRHPSTCWRVQMMIREPGRGWPYFAQYILAMSLTPSTGAGSR